MGQTCCNFSTKDPNTLAVGGTTTKMNAATKVSVTELTPQLKEAMSFAKQHEGKVIRIQANVRGFIARKQASVRKPSKKSSRKHFVAKRNENNGEIEAKLSHRSGGGRFKGGGMAGR